MHAKTPRWNGRPRTLLSVTVFVPVLWVALAGCSHDRKFLTPPASPAIEKPIPTAAVHGRSAADAEAENAKCTSCHQGVGDPHQRARFALACIDCHGGRSFNQTDALRASGNRECPAAPERDYPDRWGPGSANPKQPNTLTLVENWDTIRFVNPGDLRVAHITCGSSACHGQTVLNVKKSLMTTSAHFYGAAGYCNGVVSVKKTILGESYGPDGTPQSVRTIPYTEKDAEMSVTEAIVPLPHWEVFQPGNVFRVFEKGSRLGGVALALNGLDIPLIGLPDKLEDPGRPNNRLSARGYGTFLRIDLPLLNLQKTRLNDPYLSLFGTNDSPGDYRGSGCAGCHVIYANDRSPIHSGPYAVYGNTGRSHSDDPMIPKDEEGHPIEHRFTTGIPSSQCLVCHMHQPNSFVNTFYGFQMWSYETDGDAMWPKEQKHPSIKEYVARLKRNPEGAATRGLWGDPEFLEGVSDLNPELKHTQFADYHGHGWVFRAVYKMDRKGNLLDKDGDIVPYDDPDKFEGTIPMWREGQPPPTKDSDYFSEDFLQKGKAVHLKDIHAEKGMHCVDCHFSQDVHGSGKLHAEYQAAVEITCEDCHGNVREYAKLQTTGPASYTSAFKDGFANVLTPFNQTRFAVQNRGGRQVIVQRSMLHEGLEWEVDQVRDMVDRASPSYNAKAARAKLVTRSGEVAAAAPASEDNLAHRTSSMTCQSCHTSWITSCFGCHLPQEPNMRMPMRHYEDIKLRNYASYNPQVARDDAFMLGIAGDVHGNKVSTVRSSSAVILSSVDAQRQAIYNQIPSTATNGMSSQAFNTHFAHAVRTTETRGCEDCHVSEENDNNAYLAQTYLLGTNFVNFFGFYAYVGLGKGGLKAVQITEWDEPQAVIGSNLHRLAYPDDYQAHLDRGRELDTSVKHKSGGPEKFFNPFNKAEVLSIQARGEYLFTATGAGGFRVFDMANVRNKGFSEKIVTSPVSPLGQDTHVATKYATAVALPTNNYISMSRAWRPENREQPYEYKGRTQNMHESYRYAYVTDLEEGLIVVDVDCLSDGDPQNNFTERVATFNPGGALSGAVNLAVAGETVYVCCRNGVYAISIDDPLAPQIIGLVESPNITGPRAIAVQFRYAFVIDEDGLKVIDITIPEEMKFVPEATLALQGAYDVYVARTYAYVAAGSQGMAIVDVEVPTAPKIEMMWNDGGKLNDTRQIKVGMGNDSVFALVADGRNGFKVVQLISPEDTDETQRSAYGWSPKPLPKLIATYPTATPCVAVSKGLDRDRAVDESGNQMAVFGRIGGRPLNLEEMRRLYLRDGKLYTVSNE